MTQVREDVIKLYFESDQPLGALKRWYTGSMTEKELRDFIEKEIDTLVEKRIKAITQKSEELGLAEYGV